MMHNNKVAAANGVEIYTVRVDEAKVDPRLLNSAIRRTSHNGIIFNKTPNNTRYWLSVGCVVIGVVSAILLLVVLPAIIMNADMDNKSADLKQSLLLEDILSYVYSPKLFNGTWESDSEFSYVSKKNIIMLHNMETMTSTNLINDTLFPSTSYSFTLSPDHKYLLIAYNTSRIFCSIKSSRYNIFDIETQTSMKLLNQNLPDNDVFQYATWSTRGNALAYVYHNDVYYRSSAQNVTEHRITNTGVPELVYNGGSDWNAAMGTPRTLWFSRNGNKMAYSTYDFSDVLTETLSQYGEPGGNSSQYVKTVHVKYPKPGTPNPNVTLSVVDLEDLVKGLQNVEIIPPPDGVSEPHLADVEWTKTEEAVAMWKNRVHNKLWIIICNTTVFACETAWQTEETNGWITINWTPWFSTDGRRMLVVAPHPQDGDVGNYRHLTLIERGQPEPRVVALTAGAFTVVDVIAWDEERHLIYIKATIESDPAKLQVFSVSDNSTGAPHSPECISCGRRTKGGVECTYSNAYFSKRASFYMYNCYGPDIPEITLYNKDHILLTMWEDNHSLRDNLENKSVPDTLRLRVPVPGNMTALVHMWLPPNMEPNAKYPLLVDVYGGPDSNQITDQFGPNWSYFLTCNKSIVYAVIDGRGSGLKGDRMVFDVYRRLGSVDALDQIGVTKYLLEKYSFLDRNRTAIWGWSYGGYSTLRVLANDTAGIFKCGMAVAPVTDWMYFTTGYTETYMGMPTVEDNLKGYNESSVVDNVDNLRNKKLFLAHGTSDNIVLYHNSMMLARTLQKKGITFTQQSYPEEDHGLVGVKLHLYHSLLAFLEECYK